MLFLYSSRPGRVQIVLFPPRSESIFHESISSFSFMNAITFTLMQLIKPFVNQIRTFPPNKAPFLP
ncbi:hypothetical protein HMPREF0880_01059 [Yokenella regensburgei ATCC 43003]|nr:hypothetical protein HMPREF0880_01059 [Yokenella regensburgei ATCC 43003]